MLPLASMAPAIGAGINTAGNIISSLTGNSANRKLSREIRAWNLDQWHRQNEYNLPKNQMKRLKEAGLNPNLMYGQGDVGNASAVQSVSTPRMNPIDMGDPISTYYDLKAKAAQVRNIEADAEMKEAQAKYADESAELPENILGHQSSSAESESTIKYYKSVIEEQMANPNSSAGSSVVKRKYGRPIKYDKENMNMRIKQAEAANRELEARLKQGHAELRAMGLEPGDKVWFRLLNTVIRGINKKYNLDLPLPFESN